jgi:CRISPR-associated endonuclease/helicase Cas3
MHVLRRRDLADLFDTTPDLAGASMDVSLYVREAEDHDVHVFWREVPGSCPEAGEPAPGREEMCPVPVSDMKRREAWRFDHLDRRWVIAGGDAPARPGMVLLLRASGGAYSPELGWTGSARDRVAPISPGRTAEESDSDDKAAFVGRMQSLSEHTDAVVYELDAMLSVCEIGEPHSTSLRVAARHHDAGKAHQVFQSAMLGDPPVADAATVWAKTSREPGLVRYERVGFRHELASALAMLANGQPDLAAYLAAAHHGKVRLSIRSLPHEKLPDDPGVRFARGVWDGDALAAMDLGGGTVLRATKLELDLMEMGEGPGERKSWLARMLALRDARDLGPFRLALLEALLRAADWRASARLGGTS